MAFSILEVPVEEKPGPAKAAFHAVTSQTGKVMGVVWRIVRWPLFAGMIVGFTAVVAIIYKISGGKLPQVIDQFIR